MSEKLDDSFCIELSEIRKLDQILTQCETSSCENICRDCCAKLATSSSLDDVTDNDQVVALPSDNNYVPSAYNCSTEPRDDERPVNMGHRNNQVAIVETMEMSDAFGDGDCEECGGGGSVAQELSSNTGKSDADCGCPDDDEGRSPQRPVQSNRLERTESEPNKGCAGLVDEFVTATSQCIEPKRCDKRLTHLTVNKPSVYFCANCEKKNKRFDMRKQAGSKKHSLTISDAKPMKMRLTHKYSSENCLKPEKQVQHHSQVKHSKPPLILGPLVDLSALRNASELSSAKVPGKLRATNRRISCKIPDELESGTREALLGSRFGSLHEKKLPEPVETVCI